MFDQAELRRPSPALTYEQMLEAVRYEGAYPDTARAADAIHQVLAGLGRRLTGDERVDLAARLPAEAALTLTAQIPASDTLTGWGFVKDLAARTGTSQAVARWDTGAVLSVVARLAGPDLLARILQSLPGGYALLFGQAELTAGAGRR
ncbi:hypothetical protein GCM10010302_43490 [Streptomyces polychromogenes]|uniref:DUF2267 domain-containing protein n=1 Tax=Streptomyces polychromogenes TaxID=67342 RepID=A0ABN0VGY0_9ACTN